MKQFYFFRNSLLPLLGALAVMCAGSCSQEILEVPDDLAPDDAQTRASVDISLVSDPVGEGPGNEYYAQNRNYNFQAVFDEQYLKLMDGEITVRAIEGSDDAIKMLLRDKDRARIRFNAPGVYAVKVSLQLAERFTGPGLHPVLIRDAELICRVPSYVSSMEGPSTVMLGGEYNFKVNFDDPDYPDPTLKITESVFNDPKYTILSNDGVGNYRIRFDQPGDYKIESGIEWGASSSGFTRLKPCYYVEVFFRPEMSAESVKEIPTEGLVLPFYKNCILLYDVQQNLYTSLPFRVYFKYKLMGFPSEVDPNTGFSLYLPDIKGDIFRTAGANGKVELPNTNNMVSVDGFYYAGNIPSEDGYYWEITIPSDRCYYWNGIEHALPGVDADPDKPIIIAPAD